ncbi:MAG: 2-oxoacid:acceptor oxidoreductase family protein, partial [Syntrophales bacterium]|nr:2-oxoacid:acceptor oxidoreductase family protein [Syntrophales bacterium]
IGGELDYPSPEEIRAAVGELSAQAWFIAATDEAIKLGNPILGNIVMIGAIAGSGELPITREDFQEAFLNSMPAAKLDVNLMAFDLGQSSVIKYSGGNYACDLKKNRS